MTALSGETAQAIAQDVHDYLTGFYCFGEPLPAVSSLADVIAAGRS